MKKIQTIGALLVAAAVAAIYSGASAQEALPTVGYIRGTWLQSCQGEPLQYGRCSLTDQHVRCFQAKNPQAVRVQCNIGMKATMRNKETGFTRLNTAVEHTLMYAGANDWLCFTYDDLLTSEGESPFKWTLEAVYEPHVSCGAGNAPPPCTKQQMQQETCTAQVPMKRCDNPFGPCQ